MYDLINVEEGIYVFEAPTNIGVIKSDKTLVLIDTGYGEDKVRKLFKKLKDEINGLNINIINTHCHADHIDGNLFVKKRYNPKIMVPRKEISFIESPDIYMRSFFMNAFPPLLDKVKFMRSKPMKVDQGLEEGNFKIDDLEIEILSIPGHSPGQIGIGCKKTMFMADALFLSNIREKYPIIYYVDVDETINSLNKVMNLNYKYYVPSHGKTLNWSELAKESKSFIEDIKKINEAIIDLLGTYQKLTLENLTAKIMEMYNVEPTPEQYYLVKTSLNAHIYHLYKREELFIKVKGYKMLIEK